MTSENPNEPDVQNILSELGDVLKDLKSGGHTTPLPKSIPIQPKPAVAPPPAPAPVVAPPVIAPPVIPPPAPAPPPPPIPLPTIARDVAAPPSPPKPITVSIPPTPSSMPPLPKPPTGPLPAPPPKPLTGALPPLPAPPPPKPPTSSPPILTPPQPISAAPPPPAPAPAPAAAAPPMTPNAIPDRRQDGGAAAPPPPATVTPAPETNAPKPVPPPPVKIPAGTPKEQIRRVAFLHGAEQTANCYRFAAFFEDVALKVSKKPLYVERALLLEIAPDQTSTTVLGQVMKSGAVAIFGFLEGMRPVQRKDLQELFEKSNLFFRTIAPEDAEKRAAAIDLVVDIMLL